MKILLHICCSNCAVYPFRILQAEGHNFTGFWFNPNIHPYQEYKLRLDSLKKLTDIWHIDTFYIEDYKPQDYFKMFKGLPDTDSLNTFEKGGQGGITERCRSCYRLRLEKTAKEAQKHGFDAFSTTLLISPYQDFEQIVIIGKELADKYNVLFYFRDFRPHFRDSKALAKELGLYRQKYCGCIFSREERNRKIQKSKFSIEATLLYTAV